MSSITPILPPATIGVLGSGQLGRMFAIAARKMGYRVHTYSPDTDTPTGQVADVEIVGDYDDLDAVAKFAANVDVVTFEFENISTHAAEAAERHAPVRPAGRVLHITQNRLREKAWLRDHGFPLARFAPVSNDDDLRTAIEQTGRPAILKTAGFGYDGKGQIRIGASGPPPSLRAGNEYVLEERIDFEREVSVVAVRGADGAFAHFGAVENTHVNGILDLTVSPASLPHRVADKAIELARAILESLDVVGVMCVEMFAASDGRLIVNELAPRPHNSGHFTFDACLTSQFEQQLRAVCALPLGDTRQHRPAAMAQLLGDLWIGGEPNWIGALEMPNVKLHLYGKHDAKPGRKMGHLTALSDTPAEARRVVLAAREALKRKLPKSVRPGATAQ